jgi:bifunctional N-acetylglucosamine-1-phosphate-uridyltransferase/glucosamine-1-phosphate-acetyltransferase GlmU-like protein
LIKPLKALILAAGQGKRMMSGGDGAPKVMRLANGKPLLGYVLGALSFIPENDTIIVVGYKREQVKAAFPGYAFAVQEIQRGTGHAVIAAAPALTGFDGDLLICCGDMPLIKRETYAALIDAHRRENSVCTLLSGESDDYLPYGRVIRDENGDFSRIAEERDCGENELKTTELNAGVYIFNAQALLSVLSLLKTDNAQGEIYLTDAPALLKAAGGRVAVLKKRLGNEIIGVNTPEQLREVETLLLKAQY